MVAFIVVTFALFAGLFWFMGTERFRTVDNYSRMPGINTPNTLRSRETWVAAHTATARYFKVIAVYFGICLVVNLALSLGGYAHVGTVFIVSFLVGVFAMVPAIFVGDRVALQVANREYDVHDEEGEDDDVDGERVPVQPFEEGEVCHHEDPQANDEFSVYLHGAHGRGAVTWGAMYFRSFCLLLTI